ncbi:MAG: LTA synthase family protein [Glaciecola sp.]
MRPNRLFIEYLIYPKEVVSMLINGHGLALIISAISLSIFAFYFWKVVTQFISPTINHSDASLKTSANTKQRICIAMIAWLLIIVTLFGFARGTIGHRPLNPSLVYFSTDPLLNSLTLNSLYSVAFAIKQLGDEMHASSVYGNMSDETVLDIVRSSSGAPEHEYEVAEIPTLRTHVPSYKGKPKNLVIVLQESLGAQFVSHLGGRKITPNIDNLMNEGWAFNQLYATGTRSVRGIEAVVTGFTPTPARSVVKLANSQHNFFTIAELLKREGYITQFVYGGESHFDNMKSFFLGNGFTNIVDSDDIENPLFVASWGACDESLFIQADKELTKLEAQGKPFFSLVFTSSNHDPFDIPSGIVPVIDGEDDRDRAIRFADYALGKFIDKAKQSSYWEDTVFLVVADHDARVFGAELVPIKSFHIPGVILGKDVIPKQDNRIVSQIDLAPTLLSLMGLETRNPMIGNDLTNENAPQRAMMQFDKNFAYMEKEQVAILQPSKEPMYFLYDPQNKQLVKSKQNEELGEKALAHALFGSKAYEKSWYRLENNN